MTTIRFMYNNLWREGEIIAQSTEQAQFPADNTQDDCKSLAWRSGEAGAGLFRVTTSNQNIILGEQKLTDGELEVWTSATDLTNWTETLAGSSTVNREATTIKYGTYSCRLTIDAANEIAKISQSATLTASRTCRLTFWHNTPVGATIAVELKDSGSNVYLADDGTWGGGNVIYVAGTGAWAFFYINFTAHASYTSYNLCLFSGSGMASKSLYIDDVALTERFVAQITPGDYNATTLKAEVETQINATAVALTYTVTYSSTTNKFMIAATGKFVLCTYIYTNAAWALLGYRSTLTFDLQIWTTQTAYYARIHSIEFVDCDAGAASEYNFIALLNHNLTSSAVVTVYGADDTAFTTNVVSDILTYNGNNIFEFLTTARTKRYLRVTISDPANPSLYIRVGVIVFSKYFQPNRNFGKYSEGEVDETEMEKSPSMNLFTVQERPKVVNWDLPFVGLDATSVATIKLMRLNNGVSKALVFCTDSASPNSNSYWARFVELSPTEFKTLIYGVWTASLEEVL